MPTDNSNPQIGDIKPISENLLRTAELLVSRIKKQAEKKHQFQVELLIAKQRDQEAKDQLFDSFKQLMESLHDIGKDVLPDDGYQMLHDLYWSDESVDRPFRLAWEAVFGGKLEVGMPIVVELLCKRCNKVRDEDCKSWQSKRYIDRHSLCSRCRKIRYKENLEKAGEDYAARLAQLEEEGWYENRQQQEADRIHHLRTMPYREYLLTEHWQKMRKWALARAKYQCQLCSEKQNLHVHHKTYERRGCEDINDLIALCRECHERHHNIFPDTDES